MAPDSGPERTPLGMRLIWLLVPAVLFGLYFWMLLRGGGGGTVEEPAGTPVQSEAPNDAR